MSHTAKDILERAADLVEKGWCQGHMAEDAAGHIVFSGDPNAVCWCGTGAISRVVNPVGQWGVRQYHEAIARFNDFKGIDIIRFNDAPGRTQAEVVAALRGAAQSIGDAK